MGTAVTLPKMSNRDLVQHFVEGNTQPGQTVHKFKTMSSLSKNMQKMIESNKELKYAAQHLGSSTHLHQAKVMAQAAIKEGHLHHAKAKFGTGSNFVQHIFAKDARKKENIKQQNIEDIQKQRGINIGQLDSVLGKNATISTNQAKAQPSTPLVPLVSIGSGAADKTNAAKQRQEATVVDPAGCGVAETNLKSKDDLPKQITKPADWQKQDEEIIEMGI
ncbi:MAG: hypothetical protein WC801_04255 [Patescibacteria group bacterium]|jgi:hypothetical protein